MSQASADRVPAQTVADPIRIGLVVHVMQVAGAEMLVAATVRQLAGRLEPTIFCLDEVGDLGGRLQQEGFKVVSLGRRPGIDLGVARRLARELRRRRIEVVHAHQYSPFFYTALARLMAGGVRVILTEHGRHFPDRVSWRRRLLNRLVLSRMADAVTACCEFSRRALTGLDGFRAAQVEVVENGIELAGYGRSPRRDHVLLALGLDPRARHVACVARFHEIKDHENLVRAFAEVASRREGVDLLLVGDGPLRGGIEGLAEELGIASRVHCVGIRHDVPEILGAVDLFALTSLSEAASLTLLEAMASELPVVVTRVGGNPEIVEDGVHGHLVERRDPGAAAAAILDLLDRPEAARAMGMAGRALVERRYRLERTIERFAELYASLADGRLAAGG